MAAYRRVYDSHHVQAVCQVPESAPEPCCRQSSAGYLSLFTEYSTTARNIRHLRRLSCLARRRRVGSPSRLRRSRSTTALRTARTTYTHTHTPVVVSGVRRMNEVNARRARLVPGWVTVFGRVYHLGM